MSNLIEIKRLKSANEKKLMSLEGVTGIGVGEQITNGQRTGTVCIRVYVSKKKPKSKVSKEQMIPAKINGIPTDVIEREFVLHPAKVSLENVERMVDSTTYSTLTGGISIGPCRAVNGFINVGTLGLVVEDNTSGEKMMLSNFHVMCVDNNWSVGDTMCQPGRVDRGSCPSDVVGTLSRSSLGGQVDCAVSEITDRPHNDNITEIGNIEGTNLPVLNEQVRKRGRTTELTYGFVDDISATVSVDYENGIGVVTLTNQIMIEVDSAQSTQFGNSGDSGSVVVNENNEVIGLYFAGTSDGAWGVANPINAVFSALDIKLCTPASVGTLIETSFVDDNKLTYNWSDNRQFSFFWNESLGWGESIKNFDDVKNPAGYDTLMETTIEHNTIQEHGGYTLGEGIGNFDPRDPNIRSENQPIGAVPFLLSTPHHAKNAAQFEQSNNNSPKLPQSSNKEALENEIERTIKYLQALQTQKNQA